MILVPVSKCWRISPNVNMILVPVSKCWRITCCLPNSYTWSFYESGIAKNRLEKNIYLIYYFIVDPASPIIFKETGLADFSQTLKANITIGKNMLVLMGAEIIIHCPFKAEPKASVLWAGEQGFELQQRDVIELNEGRQLKIPKVTRMSNGFYKCIASNVFGSDFAVTRVTVVGKQGNPFIPTYYV